MSDQDKTREQLFTEMGLLENGVYEAKAQRSGSGEIEDTWRRTAERYRDVVESQTELICRYLPDGTVTFANAAYCRYFGKDLRDLIGTRFSQTVPQEDRDAVNRHFSAFSPQNPILSHEHRVIGPDGKTRWQQWTDRAVYDEQGNMREIQGVGRDVTAQKTVEQERDRLFNLSIDMLSISGFDGFFRQVNPAFTKTLSWTREELLSKPCIKFVHPDDRQRTIDAGKRLLAGETVYAFENRYQCKDGTYRWISWNAFPLSEEEMVFSVARDVTERKDAEQILRHARDELENRVQARTAQLNMMNENLLREIARSEETEKHLRRASRALKALSECNRALARTRVESALLDEICRVIVEVAGYPRAWVGFAVHDEAKTVRPVAHKGFEEGFFATPDISWADNEKSYLTGTAIRTGKPQIAKTLVTDASVTDIRQQLLRLGHVSAISLPLVVEDRVIGALTIPAHEPDAFGEDEVKFLAELAGGLSYGLTTIRRRKEQERARALLRQSEERFRKVFQQGPLGIAILGLDYRWIAVNATCCEILGYTEDELTTLTFLDITHPDDIRKGQGYEERLVRGDIPYYRLEKRYLRKGGKVVWINLTAAVVRDEEGIPIHFVCHAGGHHQTEASRDPDRRSA